MKNSSVKMFPRLTFVLGAAASGKSRFAENLSETAGLPRIYIATAQAWDDEMKAKIAAHQAARGDDWTTREIPVALAEEVSELPGGSVTLIDCATLWLSNVMLADMKVAPEVDRLLVALKQAEGPIIVVSNEVGAGIVPETTLGRVFRNEQGRLNQRLAAEADLVVSVIAGLPLVLKGTLP